MAAVAIVPILGWIVKPLLYAAVAVYVGLVLMGYATDGGRYRARLGFENPLRSVERLAVWLGVKAMAAILQGLKSTLNVLAEASAEVGETIVAGRSQKTQAEFRSRVL